MKNFDKVKDVALNGSAGSSTYALSCVYKDARYHLWINATTFAAANTILYKNPIVKRDEPGYFKTRKLSQDEGVGATTIVPAMFAKLHDLLPAFEKKLELEEAERQAYCEDQWRDELVRQAAPALFTALKAVVNFEKSPDFSKWAKVIDEARAALALTEPPKDPRAA